MLTILLIGVAGAAWIVLRAAGQIAHGIPRSNDDLVFL